MPAASSFYLGKQTVQKHVDQALTEIVQADEWLLGAFHGQAMSGTGTGTNAKYKGGLSFNDYLLVTDQRVILWARGVFSRSVDAFHYDDIASVEESQGLLLGEIVSNVRGAKERMQSMVKPDVPIAARLIRDLVAKAKIGRTPPASVPTPAPLPTPQAIYILREDGAQDGPFDAAQVQQKVFTGEANPDTYVWHEGLAEWQPLSQVVRLPSLPPARPAPPTPAPAVPAAVPRAEAAVSPQPLPMEVIPSEPTQPPAPQPLHKNTGCAILLFLCISPIMVPLMWYRKWYTLRARIWITGTFLILFAIGRSQDKNGSQQSESRSPRTSAVAPTPTPQATTETQVSWSEVNSIYNLNSTNTDLQKREAWKRFKNKTVTWSGTVASVDDGFLGTTLQVKMNADTFTSDVLVSLKRSEHAKAARLHQGDRVNFSGRLVDWGTLLPISLDQGEIRE